MALEYFIMKTLLSKPILHKKMRLQIQCISKFGHDKTNRQSPTTLNYWNSVRIILHTLYSWTWHKYRPCVLHAWLERQNLDSPRVLEGNQYITSGDYSENTWTVHEYWRRIKISLHGIIVTRLHVDMTTYKDTDHKTTKSLQSLGTLLVNKTLQLFNTSDFKTAFNSNVV